jgi:hypothetical protein
MIEELQRIRKQSISDKTVSPSTLQQIENFIHGKEWKKPSNISSASSRREYLWKFSILFVFSLPLIYLLINWKSSLNSFVDRGMNHFVNMDKNNIIADLFFLPLMILYAAAFIVFAILCFYIGIIIGKSK